MTTPIIKVRYLGPTNQRGSRFIASAFDGFATVRATVNYDYGDVDNELVAAKKLAAKMTANNAYNRIDVCRGCRFYDDKATYFGTVYTNKAES